MQERIDPKARTARYWFESLAELERYLEIAPRTWKHLHSSNKPSPSNTWDLGASYSDAARLARDGWLEGARDAQDTLKTMPPQTPAPAMRNDFYGHMPHVARYCAGAPDNMIRHANPPRHGTGATLTIAVAITANWRTNARYMRNFGLGIARYVNQLEMDGTRCEIIGVISTHKTGDYTHWNTAHAWRIKYADQPLDLAVLAFAIGHPAMFRRLGFALLERCAAPPASNYGVSRDTRLSDVINIAPGAVVLNGMKDANTHATTPEKALAYVSAQIEKAIEERLGK